jgi:leucyl aminopeptidase
MPNSTMKFNTAVGSVTQGHYPALLLPVFQGGWTSKGVYASIDKMCPVKPKDLLASGEVRGEFREFTILHLPPGNPFDRIVLIGAGKESDFTVDRLRSITAKAARTLRRMGCPQMVVVPEAFPRLDAETIGEGVAEGVLLGLYRFRKLSEEKPRTDSLKSVLFLTASKDEEKAVRKGVTRGEILANATNMVRDMANEPGNIRTPPSLGVTAQEIAKRHKLTCKVFDEKALKQMGMGGILAVSQGSVQPPRLISLSYNGAGKGGPTLALVGKGVTFDSGGISIKPSAAMHQMKYDMSGAAAVLGALEAIAQLKPKINVLGLVATAENLPDAAAYKPGDVIRMYGGKFVEIINTDAEGRMLLADALVYATENGADMIVDIATLTGGCVIALGHIASGVMGSNPWVVDQVVKAGQTCDERMWQLPLFPEYLVQIKSSSADLVNSGGAPASAVTAGMFLRQFTGERPWAHMDIAGTAWIEEDTTLYFHKPYLPKRGATGVGVRTLAYLAQQVAEVCQGDKKRLAKLLANGAH